MPRYFFQVQNGDFFASDEEGTQLASLGEACSRARRTIGEVIAEELIGTNNSIHVSVMIVDAEGNCAANLTAVTKVISSEDPKSVLPPADRSNPAAEQRVADELRRSGVLPPANED